jgi:hypothetical protein
MKTELYVYKILKTVFFGTVCIMLILIPDFYYIDLYLTEKSICILSDARQKEIKEASLTSLANILTSTSFVLSL